MSSFTTTVDRGVDTITGLVWPDARRASDEDRATAVAAVATAVTAGQLPESEAGYRRASIAAARSRSDLRHAVRGLAGGVPPQGLTTALGVAFAIWLVMTVAQVVVWLVIGMATGLDGPWWLYSTLPGAVVVGVLWLVNESHHRPRGK
jgi:hypothetical protein